MEELVYIGEDYKLHDNTWISDYTLELNTNEMEGWDDFYRVYNRTPTWYQSVEANARESSITTVETGSVKPALATMKAVTMTHDHVAAATVSAGMVEKSRQNDDLQRLH
ncbi:hypothetical protein Syun_025391 [Stephania yunnanensis]|uniref:Uncharacterized protein n=1 Tax=Stephania yunnanensis TaxID=152371 RepID=A0AAP0ERK7_9MAGN